MRKRIVLLALLVLGAFSSRATHIVGGELELQHIDGYRYDLRLILYFDVFYGSPEAEDAFADVTIFAKSSALEVAAFRLLLAERELVPYTNPGCADPILSTRKLVYTTEVNLSPNVYNEPEGYYAIWERCCRNNAISNLMRPAETGQTFLLYFPPVVMDEAPFVNSSPQLFPPLSDYACIDRFFYFDFAGTDPDGDSLVYSLAHPYNSSLYEPVPPPTPPPHPLVAFTPGLSGANPIPAVFGKQLQITPQGYLTITPTQAGLFVFSVQVDEYRDGVKIGEVRRDFQMLVRDDCPFANPPSITATLENGDPFTSGDTLAVNAGVDNCFSFFVTDSDLFTTASVEIRPVNFVPDGDLDFFTTPNSGSLVFSSDSLEVGICLPECPLDESGIFALDIVAFDNTCAKPLTDTVRMVIDMSTLTNQPPLVTVQTPPADTFYATFGSTLTFGVQGSDPEGDSVTLRVDTTPFDFAGLGMQFPTTQGAGATASTFSWPLDCDENKLGYVDVYPLTFIVEDVDECGFDKADTAEAVIRVLPLENEPTQLSAVVLGNRVTQTPEGAYVVEFGEAYTIRATGVDGNNDNVTLRLTNADSAWVQYYQFYWSGDVTSRGQVTGDVTWNTVCQFLDPGQEELGPLTLKFDVTDDFCLFPSVDSLAVDLIVRDKPTPQFQTGVATIFTPNGDEYNPTFQIPNLPTDNCMGRFEEVKVYNRWGNEVFRSARRDFEWDGAGETEGIYYWVIRYSGDLFFKGWVALSRE